MSAENACAVMLLPRGLYELDVFTAEGPRVNWLVNYSGLHKRLTWYRPCVIWWPDGHTTELTELNDPVERGQHASLRSGGVSTEMESGNGTS